MLPERIYLTGFMGSGKTTAGKKLAEQMNWTFVDLDKTIEHDTGLSIKDIFSKHGEQYFRELESAFLRRLSLKGMVVISTGGGTPCHSGNMSFMLDKGLTIYFKLTPAQLAERLTNSKTDRPLLKGLENEGLLKFIETKLEERENYYNMSAIIIDGYNLDAGYLHEIIIKIVSQNR
ncbi:MAG TPA: shikimate kinase [Bacteroidales bacterium]|nr:shikimate kinase [Bacteroidales bacterium]